jgi:peptidyl-tRNA hydrolase
MQQDRTPPQVDETAFEPEGQDPRDERPQFVMPLVVRLERDAAPQRTDALETAARAVLTLLADPRSQGPAQEAGQGRPGDAGAGADGVGGAESVGRAQADDDDEVEGVGGTDGAEGEWAAAVLAWQDGRIRKVVRRARGAEWRRAEALPGITVTGRTAEVRVYPPVPLDGWPKDLARLQVSGTDFGDDEPPSAPEPGMPVIWLNPDVEMTAGKSMAQAGHAAQLGWWQLAPERAAKWAADGFPLAVRKAAPEKWAELAASDLPMVRDAGFTEIAPGTATAIAELER